VSGILVDGNGEAMAISQTSSLPFFTTPKRMARKDGSFYMYYEGLLQSVMNVAAITERLVL
jgi:hypothetical protein